MFEQYIANDYLRALGILIVFFFVLRVVLFLVERLILTLTVKTKTDLDDRLIKKMSPPLTWIAFLIVLRIAVMELTLSETLVYIVSGILYSLLVVFATYLIYVIIDILFVTGLKRLAAKTKTDIDDTIISLFHTLVMAALIIISALYILDLWGVQIGPLLAGLGIAGLAVALALQPILSNIFSGASVVLDRSIRVGDLIYLGADVRGRIEKIGLRSTKIKTFDNEFIIIPNNTLASSNIQNVALPEPKSRASVPFGVAYGVDPDKVKDIVMKELKKIKGVVNDPEPVIRFSEMADSSLNFTAYFHVDSFENRAGAVDEANTRIYNALTKNKIEIPFPQMDVHVKKK